MGTPPLPPDAGDPIGGWSVEDAAGPDAVPPAEPAAETGTRPRPARRERPPVERRPRPAGHALVVVVLALAVSLLLNAPGLHKSAHAQPAGWERDVALGVTGPLDAVSGALLLDRPREGVKALLGRSDDDDIDTEVALPPAGQAAGTPATPAPTVRRTFTKQKPMRLWVAGDSLVVVPGQSIVRASGASPVMEPVGGVEGRVATGLERPDVFNWFRYVPERMRELRPNVVVLSFGGNDDHGYMTGLPSGVELDGFGSDSWRAEYARRVGGLFDTIARRGAYTVWIGLPITRDAEQTQRFDVINAVVAAEARKRPRKATYVDTYTTFASDTGGFAEYLYDPSGQLVRVRASDGVHFEPRGGDMIAREVLKRLNKVFDLTSWRQQEQAASG